MTLPGVYVCVHRHVHVSVFLGEDDDDDDVCVCLCTCACACMHVCACVHTCVCMLTKARRQRQVLFLKFCSTLGIFVGLVLVLEMWFPTCLKLCVDQAGWAISLEILLSPCPSTGTTKIDHLFR